MIVVDTSALLAILNKVPERDRLLDVLANDDRVMVSAVTLCEIMLVAATRRGPDNLGDLAQLLETVEAEIVPFDADQARAAQAVYMRYGKGINPTARLHLCDCVAYSLAKHLDVPLLFMGDDFVATDISGLKASPGACGQGRSEVPKIAECDRWLPYTSMTEGVRRDLVRTASYKVFWKSGLRIVRPTEASASRRSRYLSSVFRQGLVLRHIATR